MMLKEGTIVKGFELLRSRHIKEQGGILHEFKHIRTGAELCFLDSPVENKTFYIAFKTIPFDNTGVFHILEHSVLCGSEKYPVREPFVELLKSSMQTFLNALTFSDKTVYPVSSRNSKDFLNLMAVYLDAVFAPICIRDVKIFMQEGWRIDSTNGEYCINGVVYSEMQGAMSDPDSISERCLNELLYPDSCYRFVSGGVPSEIPYLSYNQFVNTYRKFYHPGNCKLYLDGSVPLNDSLELIDGYLCKFDKPSNSVSSIPLQKPISGRKTVYYEIAEDESEQDMGIFTIARLFGSWKDKDMNAAMMLLIESLSDSNSAPLKKRIIEKRLASDVDIGLITGTAQNTLYFTVYNANPAYESEIVDTIKESVSELIKQGIDKKDIEARLCAWEFQQKDKAEPVGIYRGLSILDSWLYGGDPAMYLQYEDTISHLKEMLEGEYFELLLKELMPEHNGVCYVWALPSKQIAKEKIDSEKRTIADFLNADDADYYKINSGKLSEFKKWQQSWDDEENMSKLPKLSLDDVDGNLIHSDTVYSNVSKAVVLKKTIYSEGLAFCSMYFRLTDYNLEDFPPFHFLSAILGELSTEKHIDVPLLKRDIKLFTDGVSFHVSVASPYCDSDHCSPFFNVKFATDKVKAAHAAELVHEILSSTILEAEEVRKVLLQEIHDIRDSLSSRGRSMGIAECLSSFSSTRTVLNECSGIRYYQYLLNFRGNFNEYFSSLSNLYCKFKDNTLCRKRLILSIGTNDEGFNSDDILRPFKDGFSVNEIVSYNKAKFTHSGIIIPTSIGFAVSAWKTDLTTEQRGILAVAAQILSLNFLWNKVRVQGGAYGAGFSVNKNGELCCYSYRDPNPEASIGVFKDMASALESWCDSGESIDRYIISLVSELNPLLSPKELVDVENIRYLESYPEEERQRIMNVILSMTSEKIRSAIPILKDFSANCATCIVGSKELMPDDGRVLFTL